LHYHRLADGRHHVVGGIYSLASQNVRLFFTLLPSMQTNVSSFAYALFAGGAVLSNIGRTEPLL
jgi:hypothetical protein